MELIDSHCHLDLDIFDTDRDEVILAAKQQKVSRIIVPSVTRDKWCRLARLQKKYSLLEVAYGLHPMFMEHHRDDSITELRDVLKKNKAVAVGECGLDLYVKQTKYNDKERQINLFNEQLKLASEFSLPVIVHARKSVDLVLKVIRKYPEIRGVVHSFSGSQQQAEMLIKQGFMLGFGGPITYTRATRLRKIVAELPLESILLETDAPDQPDSQHHGQRNVPANLPHIAHTIAELKACELQKVAQVTTENAKLLFQLD